MAKAKRSTLNSIAISLIMGAIIVAFLFTGVQSFTNSSNIVATVDDKEVSTSEFNRLFQTFISQREQATGKSMTQKEIRESGMQGFVLEQLISQKIGLLFAESLNFNGGNEVLKHTITTQYEAFKTGGKFDINKYKSLLRTNGISIAQFEDDIINQVKLNKMNELFDSLKYSKAYVEDRIKFQNSNAKVIHISFEKEAMTKNLSVPKVEINEFLGKESSKPIIDSLYTDYLSRAGKKPKTRDQMKSQLAKQHLQKTKREELKSFNEKLKKQLNEAFADQNWNKVQSIAKKYSLNFNKKGSDISLLNPNIPGVNIKAQKLTKHFINKDTKTVIQEDNPIHISFVKFNSFFQAKNKANKEALAKSAVRSIQYQAMNHLRSNATIKKNLATN